MVTTATIMRTGHHHPKSGPQQPPLSRKSVMLRLWPSLLLLRSVSRTPTRLLMRNMELSTLMMEATISRSDVARNETVAFLPPFVETDPALLPSLEVAGTDCHSFSFLSLYYLASIVVTFGYLFCLDDS